MSTEESRNVPSSSMKTFVNVDQEGEPFPVEAQTPPAIDPARELPLELLRGSREDINLFRASGFDVDDDNDPAPENVPVNDSSKAGDHLLKVGQEWKKDGLCRRKMADARNIKPSIGMNGVLDLKIMTLFAFFKLFFPLDWFTRQFFWEMLSRT